MGRQNDVTDDIPLLRFKRAGVLSYLEILDRLPGSWDRAAILVHTIQNFDCVYQNASVYSYLVHTIPFSFDVVGLSWGCRALPWAKMML